MRTFQILLLLALFGAIFSQDCNNPIQNTLNIDGLAEPTPVQGNLTFCPAFQSQNICCSAETINGFQDRINQATNNLQNLNSQRDEWLAASYNDGFPIFLQNWFLFQANMAFFRNRSEALFNAARAKFLYINETAGALRQELASLRENFAQYQQARVECQSTVLDFLASAHCLACNPNYRNLGVSSDGNINLNQRVCTSIKTSCFRFVELSNSYSLFIALRRVSEELFQANEFLRGIDLSATDEEIIADINDESTPYDAQSSEADAERQVTFRPPNCQTAATCDWLCNDVFNNANINTQLLSLGGVPQEEISLDQISQLAGGTAPAIIPAESQQDDGEDVVFDDDSVLGPVGGQEAANEEEDFGVLPVTGSWNPADGQSGAQIQLVPNPANVAVIEANATSIEQGVQAFQEPTDPASVEDRQEAALSGGVMTISTILLVVLSMFYLD